MAKYVARCRLTLHDNLYYASREMGRAYETEKFLHNYGLTYALGLVRPAPAYFNGLQVPRYQNELKPERVGSFYVTPARPLKLDFAFITFKMANVPYYSFTPKVIENRVVFGRAKELAPGSVFEFFVFADEAAKLPSWLRLGKWMSKAELIYKWYQINKDDRKEAPPERPVGVSCALNPLDIRRERLFSYDVVPMPPVSLLANPTVSGPYYSLPDEEFLFDKATEPGPLRDEDKSKSERENLRSIQVPLELSYFGGEK